MNWDYVAGFFDGEGCISFYSNKTKYLYPYLYLSNTNLNTLQKIMEFIGCGKIRELKPQKTRFAKKKVYRLEIKRYPDCLRIAKELVSRCVIANEKLLKVIELIQCRKWVKSAPHPDMSNIDIQYFNEVYTDKRLKATEIMKIFGWHSRSTVRTFRIKHRIPLRRGYPTGDYYGRDKKGLRDNP